MNHRTATPPPEPVVLGRVVRAQGLRGLLRVHPFGVQPALADRLVGKPLLLRPPRPDLPPWETVLQSQRRHGNAWILQVAGCSDRTRAEQLVHWDVCLDPGDLPELSPGEYYLDELAGMQVVDNATGQLLGQVERVQPSAAADLLRVRRPGGNTFLVPLVRDMIRAIENDSRTIRVDLPDGLIDLND